MSFRTSFTFWILRQFVYTLPYVLSGGKALKGNYRQKTLYFSGFHHPGAKALGRPATHRLGWDSLSWKNGRSGAGAHGRGKGTASASSRAMKICCHLPPRARSAAQPSAAQRNAPPAPAAPSLPPGSGSAGPRAAAPGAAPAPPRWSRPKSSFARMRFVSTKAGGDLLPKK